MTSKTLVESSKKVTRNNDGTFKAILITPGQGSSGYYSEDMLRAFGPEAFPKGTHSYENHLEEGEHRTPSKLMAVTTEDAYYEDNVGLVANMKPLQHWRDFVEEVAPHVGLSISAEGTGEMSEVDGSQTFVVESLIPNIMNTVDFVSYAGRGGKVAEALVEAALNGTEPPARSNKKENEHMATLEETVPVLVESVQKLVDAQEAATAAAEANKPSEDDVRNLVAEAVKGAVAAARQVAAAEVSEKLADKLYAQIEAGDYDVEDKLAEYAEIRNEVTEQLRESNPGFVGSFATQGLSEGHSYGITSWNGAKR